MNRMMLEQRIRLWLEEDMPFGDITTDYIVTNGEIGRANLIAKGSGILCGVALFKTVFSLIDENIKINYFVEDGESLNPGTLIAELEGPLNALLKGERTALNLIQRLSGIATEAAAYAKAVEGLPVKIVDTRKTTPGLRYFEKMAVRVGGCSNHRFSLSDAVMIKDNHIIAAGGIEKAVIKVRPHIPYTSKIEVEVDSFDALKEAVAANVDIIMLDNMTTQQMSEAVAYIRQNAENNIVIEASGNMSLERVNEVARAGVDIISVGALTHSVKAMDISLKFIS